MDYSLRFDGGEIGHWASRYEYPGEKELIRDLVPIVKRRGHLRKDEFLEVCKWKTTRSQSKCRKNPSQLIEDITAISLRTNNDILKIGVLNILNGVSWPTASVFLHFFDEERYPILDVRALWSLSIDDPPPYNFQFWIEYVQYCRQLADKYGVDMRTLDRALWQYSKENQTSNG